MMISICIQCGTERTAPMEKCRHCGLIPRTDQAKAKSLILSTAYEIRGDYKGKTVHQLREISDRYRSGQAYGFDEDEVAAVIAYARQVEEIPAHNLIVDGLKWLVPPILLIAILFYLS